MANTLKGKKIVLGITGSIAAYKACYIIRGLIKQGAEVQVVITPAGKEFITPITLSALTSKPVISEFFAQRDGTWNSHVDLGPAEQYEDLQRHKQRIYDKLELRKHWFHPCCLDRSGEIRDAAGERKEQQ